MAEHCKARNRMGTTALAILTGLLLFVAPRLEADSRNPQTAPPSEMAPVQPSANAAQAAVPVEAAPSAASPTAQAPSQEAQEGPQILHLMVGRSLVITSPRRIRRVSVADPSIIDAVVVTPYQVLVNGKAPGGVSLLLWDDSNQSQAFEVSVDIDILSLSEKIHQVFPNEQVQIETSKDSVILSGHASSAAVAEKIYEVVKNATPKVTSLIETPAVQPGEILLEVKFAEVDRSVINQFGVNLLSLPGAQNIGTVTTQQFSPPSITGTLGPSNTTGSGGFTLNSLLNIFIWRPDINLAATIQALENQNILQILAEPNLLTASGKDASFLAGGQFPYPVLQSTGGAGGYAGITIEFKEYGVRLNFTPTIMPDGLIHLKVAPEVSSLDFTNALIIQGFTIPALATRRVESEMDLRDGQSFAIAGLIDNQVQTQLEKVPGIGDIPILGKLFQSYSTTKSKDELLVIVTPRIVQPLTQSQLPPGPAFSIPFLPPTTAVRPNTTGTK
ncbi:MAG TPA: type II and III secretion system protein family protein [Candidatus Acidoferrales bacterium]|nr:type II and III secretion system protein family protein [Candidatus Acidoferrales bacterium]